MIAFPSATPAPLGLCPTPAPGAERPNGRVRVPPTALRRSWLLEQLDNVRGGLALHRELARLNRAAATRCDFRDPRACLAALYREAAARFPVSETFEIDMLTVDPRHLSPDDLDDWRNIIYYGIPQEVQGYHPERGDKVCDLVCLDLNNYFERPDDLTHFTWSQAEAERLAGWWPGKLTEAQRQLAGRPAGLAFTGVWRALPDLVDYVTANTLNGWLDTDQDDQQEMEMPRWTAGEIRSMETGWKKAKPVLQRIERLSGYIAADLPRRMPRLDLALRGDPRTVAAISRPVQGKTLAEVFGKAATW